MAKQLLKGHAGFKGHSAYDIAVEMGFKGSKEEWLESLKDESLVKAEKKERINADSNLQSQINNLSQGSPKGKYSTVAELQAANPANGIYLVTSNGHIYSWTKNQTGEPEDLGVYQSTGIADKSIKQSMLDDEVMNNFNCSTIINDFSSFDVRRGTVNLTTTRDYSALCFPRIWFPKGTIVEFVGDLSVFTWAIVVLGGDYSKDDVLGNLNKLSDSNWLNNTSFYETPFDGFLALDIAYKSMSGYISDEILNNFSNYFKIKLPNELNKKIISYNNDIKFGKSIDLSAFSFSRMGSRNNITRTYACVLLFTTKLKAGTVIEFKQPENKNFRWAIVECITFDMRGNAVIVDSGWKNTDGKYVTVNDNCYVTLTLGAATNDDEITESDMNYLYTAFTVIPKNQINDLSSEVENLNSETENLNEDIENLKNNTVNVKFVNVNNNIRAINHRGYNTIAPENTLSAYKLSKKMGFEYVETDVSFTCDGVAVLLHDSTIDRTSNGTGNIKDLTFDYVRTLDFGSWKSSDYAGEQIPSFEEFISLCKNIGLHPYIELKSDTTYTEAQIQGLVDIVKKYGMKNSVTWISFNYHYLEYIKNYDESARLGYTTYSITASNINTITSHLKNEHNDVFIDVRYTSLTDETIALCVSNDVPLEVWCVDTQSEVISLNSYVTGVTSNNLKAGEILYNANIG